MAMHVVLLCQGFPPANRTGARRPYFLARSLKDQGHRVTVICDGTQTSDQWSVDLEGIEIHRLPRIHVPREGHPALRITWKIHQWLTTSAFLRPFGELFGDLFLPPNRHAHIDLVAEELCAEVDRPSIVVATGPPWIYFHYARELAFRWHVPFSIDYRDPWNIAHPEVALAALHRGKGLRGRIVRMRYERMERDIGRSAACITAATAPFLDNALVIIGERPALTVQNGTIIRPQVERYRNDKLVIVHTGTLYEEQEWGLLYEGLRSIHTHRPDLTSSLDIRLIGAHYGGDASRFRSIMEQLRALPFVHMEPRVGREEALAAQTRADLLLNVGFKNKMGILPLKFLEYLGSRNPILQVSTGHDLPENIIQRTGAGTIVNGVKEIHDELIDLLQDHKANRSITTNINEQELEQHSWNNRMKEWIDLLSEHIHVS